jgi:hypothetical protein
MPKTVVMVSLVFGQDVHQVLIATGGHISSTTSSNCWLLLQPSSYRRPFWLLL